MAKKIMKKKSGKKIETFPEYEFASPLSYYKNRFGLKEERIGIFNLDSNVAELKNNFQIFENLNRIEEWPVSTLIQRELDHKRASQICRDYLLGDSNTKFFPSLIAVLIPTDKKYMPCPSYGEVTEKDITALNTLVCKPRSAEFEEYEEPVPLSKGIFTIPFDDNQGYITWNKKEIVAIIIDGQHRYKALKEAAKTTKEYEECHINITLIDLTNISATKNLSPPEISRDLFVTINNTPVEVSESRLVLMDDRDAIATFTQVLVDDSNEGGAAVPPELIDWECDGGKHDISRNLTGVLTLRQCIQAAMFENKSLSSIDARSNQRLVRKWIDQMELWINPDVEIERQLGSNEKLSERYSIASKPDDEDDEDDSNLFLFSYSSSASKIIKERFHSLYLAPLKHLFEQLSPFYETIELAKKHNVFNGHSLIRKYFRSFRGRRKEIEREGEIKKELNAYTKAFQDLTKNNLLYTVMGQKSVFCALFNGFLADKEDDDDSKNLVELTDEFVTLFNSAYMSLKKSDSYDENFFNIDFKVKSTAKAILSSGNLGRIFWRGIVLKYNGEIDYGITAVKVLEKIITDCIEFMQETDKEDFSFSKRKEIIRRHVTALKKHDETLEDEDAQEMAKKIVKIKEATLRKLLSA